MTWPVVGIVILVILFFSLRVRTVLTWNREGLRWQASFLGIPLSPYGKRKKHSKDENSKPGRKRKLSVLTEWLPAPELLPDLLEDGVELFRKFRRIHRVELVRVHYCSAGTDPYTVVVTYNRVGNLLEALDSFLEGRCRKKDLYVTLDFDAQTPEADVEIRASVHILRYFTLLRALAKIGSLYRSSRVTPKTEAAETAKSNSDNPQ